jgi:hypothetical protein
MTSRVRQLMAATVASAATVLLVPVGAAASSPNTLTTARAALAGLHIGGPNQPAPNESASSGALRISATTTALNSQNWSGWADNHSAGDSYRVVSAHWTQPSITCIRSSDTEIAVFWVGIDGLSSNTVEQDGTLAVCLNGTPAYFSWWEMYPTNSIQVVSAVNPGDKITSKVTFKSGQYHLVVTDKTTASGSFTKTATCGSGVTCANTSAEWIAERPSSSSSLYVLPHFATWHVTGAAATAAAAGVISAFPNDKITMVNSASTVLAKPSALNAAGNGFSVAWKASA